MLGSSSMGSRRAWRRASYTASAGGRLDPFPRPRLQSPAPLTPWAEVAQTGRAPPCQGGCRGFKSRLPLHVAGPAPAAPAAFFGGSVATRTRMDRAAVERAFADFLRALGLDAADEPELGATPARVADLYAEILAGTPPAPAPEIATFPHAGGDDLVVVRDLPFHSLCVHHFIPFFGRAHVAYLPADRLLGISGAARLLEHYARRPQLQERL